MRIEPEVDHTALVFLGRFNPAIFQPQWFGHHGLISVDIANDAEIELIHPEISKFGMGKFDISVDPNRFSIDVSSPPFIDAVDFVERIFREFMSHTPIFRMGINRQVHFSVGTEDARNVIGETLAPHEPWGDWGANMDRPFPHRGGLRSLIMEERGLEDRPNGHFQVKIEPSTIIKNNTGILVATNDDYLIDEPNSVDGCQEIMDFLHDNFQLSMDRSETIVDQIMALKS